MNKIMKSFRIESLRADELQELASKYGKSQSDILETLVSIAHRMCLEEEHLNEFRKDDFEWFFTH